MIMMIQYILTAVISYFGLLAGIIVSTLAKEELKPGRKYFVLLQHAILVILALLSFYLFIRNWILLLSFMAIVIFLLVISGKRNISTIVYPLLGLAFFFTAGRENAFFLISSLIFVYGMLTAALLLKTQEKSYLKLFKVNLIPLLQNAGFLIVALLLPALR